MTDKQRTDLAGASTDDGEEYAPDFEHRALWARAKSLDDVGELMARWLTGEITYQPGDAGPGPDSETRELIPVLADLNRAGFVTDFSQPGTALDDQDSGQRAAVSGVCSQATAACLSDAVRRTELVYLERDMSDQDLVSLVVTLDEGTECTWTGRGHTLEHYEHDLTPALMNQLWNAQYMEIFDPRWGRNDLLWPTLRAALAGA